MAELLRMPEVAAAATTAVLSAWPLGEGTAFGQGDAVAVVETDKAEVEVPATADGVLLKTLVQPGVEVEVGSPIAVLGTSGEQVADLDALLSDLGVAQQVQQPTAVRRVVADASPDAQPNGDAGPRTPTPLPPKSPAARHGRVFASPLARRMAREAGLSIADITGTGPGGRIVRRDVTAAIAAHQARPHPMPGVSEAEQASGPAMPAGADPRPASADPTPGPSAEPATYEDVPHTRMRRTIADRLTQSKQSAPHFYLRATCHADALLAFREQVNASAPVKVSVNDLLIKAVAKAHVLVPEMNAVWTADAVRRFQSVDISVAIATGTGLVTPVLRQVEAKSVSAIAAEVRTFADQAKRGGLRPDDLTGGSITITNLGMHGVEEFTAIINPPQAAILAVGAAHQEPVVIDGALEVASVLRLVLSVDHRPIDGVVAARWMKALTTVLHNPIQILV